MGNEMQITFRDAQNSQSKTYRMAVGSKITITNSVYELKKDGLYQDGKKLKDNVVNVILPQLSAVSLFDADKDGDIDSEDSKQISEKADEYLADKLDNALMSSNSKYHVERTGYGVVSTYALGNTFAATFENQTWQYQEGREVRSIFIELPEK
ncbi:MAG: hypothetical protein MJ237_08090 [bacterium]|nr:hypothetical protein [bacterium]